MIDWAIWGNPLYTILTIIGWAAILWFAVKTFILAFIARIEDGRWDYVFPTNIKILYIKFVGLIIAIALMGVWSSTFWTTVGPHTTPDLGPEINRAVRSEPLDTFTPVPNVVISDLVDEREEKNREENRNAVDEFRNLGR